MPRPPSELVAVVAALVPDTLHSLHVAEHAQQAVLERLLGQPQWDAAVLARGCVLGRGAAIPGLAALAAFEPVRLRPHTPQTSTPVSSPCGALGRFLFGGFRGSPVPGHTIEHRPAQDRIGPHQRPTAVVGQHPPGPSTRCPPAVARTGFPSRRAQPADDLSQRCARVSALGRRRSATHNPDLAAAQLREAVFRRQHSSPRQVERSPAEAHPRARALRPRGSPRPAQNPAPDATHLDPLRSVPPWRYAAAIPGAEVVRESGVIHVAIAASSISATLATSSAMMSPKGCVRSGKTLWRLPIRFDDPAPTGSSPPDRAAA